MASERKTEQAKQLLVRYIRDHQLQSGARLPSQDFLRKEFNVGTATIGTAINELKNDGVLETRDKVGVFVIDPNADGHAGRRIGITARYTEESPYYCCLINALLMKLMRSGCSYRLFCYDESRTRNEICFDIADYPGLKRSVENGELDGIIHLDDFKKSALRFIEKHRIPLLFVGSIGSSPNGFFFDQEQMLRELGQTLSAHQAERPALYCSGGLEKYLLPTFQALFPGRNRVFTGRTLEDGEKIALEIAALPEAERPDWIIYMDDIIAQKITSTLILHLPPEKCPGAALISNKQLMLSYPVLHSIVYTVDLVDVANSVVEMLIGAMKSGTVNPGKRYYQLNLNPPNGDSLEEV